MFLKKFWSDYGVVGVLGLIIVGYGLYMLYQNLGNKGSFGGESMTQTRNAAYSNPQPAQESGNEVFAGVQGGGGAPPMQVPQVAATNNPSDLLPKDTNSEWAAYNPVGKGNLADVNMLKAGYHIGIDTIGQTLRNANQQLRSDPPIPQSNTGIWNQSTITPDFIRVPFELGQGAQ